MQISIWDIDNCLSDDRHRTHLIDPTRQGDEKYAAYNTQMHLDPVCNLSLFKVFQKMSHPVFATGRPERFRDTTFKWIEDSLGVWKPTIYMRPNDTIGLTPVKLKETFLEIIMGVYGRSNIIGAFDDIPAVVEMYQRHRIPACVLQVHPDLARTYTPEDLK